MQEVVELTKQEINHHFIPLLLRYVQVLYVIHVGIYGYNT